MGLSFLGEYGMVSPWHGGHGLATHPFVTLSLGAVPVDPCPIASELLLKGS